MTNNKENPDNFTACESAMELVKEEIGRVLSSSPSIVRKYTEHLKTTSGKYIRATAVLACAENDQGLVHKDAVKFAAAIELLHLATLVHDDVIDNADIRRGSETLQKKYGKRTAVICGDYLLCMALKMASSIENRNDFLSLDVPDYMSKVCLGELNQHINNWHLDLTLHQYFKIIQGKTAALFEASFFAGAILVESNKSVLRKYMNLGRYIGMIFQITDDCMDFEMTKYAARKPVQSDYEQGVVTLPLIYALKKLAAFKERLKNGLAARADINQAVAETGALDYARSIAGKYYEKSMLIIDQLDVTQSKKSKLKAILDKASRLT